MTESTVRRDPQKRRNTALTRLSEALKIAYDRDVIVLIDEYDAPIHSAIENGYADLVCFSVLSSSRYNSQPSLFRPVRSLQQSSAYC
jgi:hypothetical protein